MRMRKEQKTLVAGWEMENKTERKWSAGPLVDETFFQKFLETKGRRRFSLSWEQKL